MPVSHLGLTVSHIPSATSFYLDALQPLGYRYIGCSGDSIGLGIDEPDFFLTQAPRGTSASPTHIAFRADDRLDVRNCYASALRAGAYPSGAPGYKDAECNAFHAAVEDLDGNVVEFVFREGVEADEVAPDDISEPQSSGRVLAWQKDVARSGVQDENASISSRLSRAKSRAETIMSIGSSASKRSRSAAPAPSRSNHASMGASTAEFPSKAILGTIIGLAAGAGIAWAMTKAEHDSDRAEQAFASSQRSRARSRMTAEEFRNMGTGTAFKAPTTAFRPQTTRAPGRSRTEFFSPRSHRNFSTTESMPSQRFPPSSMPRAMRAIEPAAYNDDDSMQEVMTRFTSARRPLGPSRSHSIDAFEYAPVSNVGPRSQSTAKRSATLPIEPREQYLLEAPKPASVESHHSTGRSEAGTSRRSTHSSVRDDPAESTASRRSERAEDKAKSSASRRSERRPDEDEEARSTASRKSERRPEVEDKAGSTTSRRGERPPEIEEPASVASRRRERQREIEDSAKSTSSRRSERRSEPDDKARSSTSRRSERQSEHEDRARSSASRRSERGSERDDTARNSTSRRSERRPEDDEKARSTTSRRSEDGGRAKSTASHRSDHRSPHEDKPKSTTSRLPDIQEKSSHHSEYRSTREVDDDLKRRDSGISMHSHRSSRHHHRDDDRRSNTSTIKPSSRRPSTQYDSAIEVPLPGSAYTYTSAAGIPMPASRPGSYTSTAQVPIPESHGDGWDSDGLGDMRTVVPEDSISCVDLTKPRVARSSGGRRSEAGASRATVPARKKEGERKRGIFSHA